MHAFADKNCGNAAAIGVVARRSGCLERERPGEGKIGGREMKPRAPVQPVGRTLWRRVGVRIRTSRTHFRFTNQRLADALGIDLRTYDAYEACVEQAPAWVLTELAELLAVSMLWFFQDVT